MRNISFNTKRTSLAVALAAALAAPGAFAATINVNTTADTVGGASCSLRDAILSVNAGSDQGGCVAVVATEGYATNDTINLPTGTYRLALGGLDEKDVTPATNPPTSTNIPDASIGDLDILKSVKIVGSGSGTTRVEWNPAETNPTQTDRIFHIYTTAGTPNVDVAIQGVTLAGGKTFEVDLLVDPGDANFHYWLRRAGGALALGAAANVVHINTTLTGSDNANAGGMGGSTGGESGATAYTLALSDVIIDGNTAEGDGGGAYIAAPTTATNLILRNNKSSTNGGGLYNEANTSLIDSTINDNRAEGGGGLFGTGSNTVLMNGVTFSKNRAIGGGAVSGRSGVLVKMVNSTISGNIARDVGAGLYTNSAVSLNFVTIANNLSPADPAAGGAGINTFPSGSVNVDMKNVLLAANKKGGFVYVDTDPTTDPTNDTFVWPSAATIALLPSGNCGQTGATLAITSLGNNLSSDATCTTLIQATDKTSVDPMINDLASNGGSTQTHLLQAGSPALGAGAADAAVTIDQRGVTRDAIPDIGAVEIQAPVVVTPPGVVIGGGGGGGCTLNPNADFDPGLLGLLSAAIGGLFWRRRRQGAANR